MSEVVKVYSPKAVSSEPVKIGQYLPPVVAYHHVQSRSSAVWTIVHNLGFFPNVTVVDSGGTVVEGEIDYPSKTTVVLTFTSAFAGTAYLS